MTPLRPHEVRHHVSLGLRTSLASELGQAARPFGVTLTVVQSVRGVVLEGVARTFYGKQMAQELARKANLLVTANRIVVDRTRSS